MKLPLYILILWFTTFESSASGGNGSEPPGDVYYCVKDSYNFLIGTENVKETFAKIDKEWACLSREHLKLCKETIVMAFTMYKKGYNPEASISSAINSKGAWTIGLCKERN